MFSIHLRLHIMQYTSTRHVLIAFTIEKSSSSHDMKAGTQREVSCSSSQPQPRCWMEVSGQSQAPVAYTTMCSKLQKQLFPIALKRYLFRTSTATTTTLNRTSCVLPQHYQVNSKTVYQIKKLNTITSLTSTLHSELIKL